MRLFSALLAFLINLASASAAEAQDNYDQFCAACHVPGTAGAPVAGDPQVSEYFSSVGMERLLNSVIDGKQAMPPMGTCFDCTEDDLRALVRLIGDGEPALVEPGEPVDTDGDGVPDHEDDYPEGRFDDVPIGHWALADIEALARLGITLGCGNNNYCPDAPVTRAQMAIFLERGIHGPDFVTPDATGTVFGDVGANDFAADYIERFYHDGITTGCAIGQYCPDSSVTRSQMAVFLLRMKRGPDYRPGPASGAFTDVPLGHWAAAWIEQLADDGITNGCGVESFCPEASVTRAQMAAFIMRSGDPLWEPDNQIRKINPGDYVEYSGTLTIQDGAGGSTQSDVTARLEYAGSAFDFDGKAFLDAQVTIRFTATGESVASIVHVQQGEDGSVHTLADEDSAYYYSLGNNTYGLLSWPSRAVPPASYSTEYRLLHETDASQTKAVGSQTITVSGAQRVSVPLGSFDAFVVTAADELEHTASTDGFDIGDRLVSETIQWIVPQLDAVRVQVTLRQYDSIGNLETTRVLDIEATGTNIP